MVKYYISKCLLGMGKVVATKNKKVTQKLEFKEGDYVVYPTLGVGMVTGIENREIAGQKLKLFVVNFEKE